MIEWIKNKLHRAAHYFGSVTGTVEHWRDGDMLMVGFKCATCGELSGAQPSVVQDDTPIEKLARLGAGDIRSAADRLFEEYYANDIDPPREAMQMALRNAVNASRGSQALVSWFPASQPPDGEIDMWSRDVVAVTLDGSVFRIAYSHGPDGRGVWQRTSAMADLGMGGKVRAWTELPNLRRFDSAAMDLPLASARGEG